VSTPAPKITLTGTITYLQRVALTPEAELQIELRDATATDPTSMPILKQVIRRPGQVPIAFSLEVDPEKILPAHAYAVSARITDRGQLQFVTERPVPALTGDAKTPAPVEILVVPVR
jgi:putative lipoprotein